MYSFLDLLVTGFGVKSYLLDIILWIFDHLTVVDLRSS